MEALSRAQDPQDLGQGAQQGSMPVARITTPSSASRLQTLVSADPRAQEPEAGPHSVGSQALSPMGCRPRVR